MQLYALIVRPVLKEPWRVGARAQRGSSAGREPVPRAIGVAAKGQVCDTAEGVGSSGIVVVKRLQGYDTVVGYILSSVDQIDTCRENFIKLAKKASGNTLDNLGGELASFIVAPKLATEQLLGSQLSNGRAA